MPRVDAHSLYAECLDTYGTTAEGLHFHSAHTQVERFRVLRALLPESLESVTLVDVGCGFGDLHRFLDQTGDRPGRSIGVDIHERMVETARERSGAEIRLLDALSDPLPEADYTVCSGAMNTLMRDEARLVIERCFAASRKGFVFNLLHGHDRSLTYNYREPAEIEEWASELGAECSIVDGYLHEDFTAALIGRA